MIIQNHVRPLLWDVDFVLSRSYSAYMYAGFFTFLSSTKLTQILFLKNLSTGALSFKLLPYRRFHYHLLCYRCRKFITLYKYCQLQNANKLS